jgi:hypothetical protein
MTGGDDDWIFSVAPFATGAMAVGLFAVGVYSVGFADNGLLAAICFLFAGLFAFLAVGNWVLRERWKESDDERQR